MGMAGRSYHRRLVFRQAELAFRLDRLTTTDDHLAEGGQPSPGGEQLRGFQRGRDVEASLAGIELIVRAGVELAAGIGGVKRCHGEQVAGKFRRGTDVVESVAILLHVAGAEFHVRTDRRAVVGIALHGDFDSRWIVFAEMPFFEFVDDIGEEFTSPAEALIVRRRRADLLIADDAGVQGDGDASDFAAGIADLQAAVAGHENRTARVGDVERLGFRVRRIHR